VADRRLPTVIATLAVVLVAAVLRDLLAPLVRRHGPRGVGVTDSVRRAPAPQASPPTQVKGTQLAAGPQPRPADQQSYFDQLARADSRRRIRASAGYTYLSEVVAESADSSLHRWDDRADRPVRVYLPPGTVANFQPAFLDAVRNAFQRWAETGVPVRFAVGPDSTQAEVQFHWKVQFEIDRTGQTDLTWDQDGHILSSIVTIATFDPHGRPLAAEDIQVVAIHEIGHVLGLDHSSDSSDIMFPSTRVRDLSARDIRTALLLYQLAPGSLR
jgi:predicted Zn-dependent protease